jgi:hypothetical protein
VQYLEKSELYTVGKIMTTIGIMASQYFCALSDKQAIDWMVDKGGLSSKEASDVVGSLRREVVTHQRWAAEAKIHFKVLPGCTFHEGIASMDPVWWQRFYSEADGCVLPDLPTERCLTSWIPGAVHGSTQKVWLSEQREAFLAMMKSKLNLPGQYELSYGSALHVAGMGLAHLRETGAHPFRGKGPDDVGIRTDDMCPLRPGKRIVVGWRDQALSCELFSDDEHSQLVGTSIVGVLKALKP